MNLQTKLSYSFVMLLVAVIGVVGLAQNSVPGDTLFAVRKATDKIQTNLMLDESSKYSFDIANKRLEDLNYVVKENKQSNVSFAVKEFKASIVGATQKIIESYNKDQKPIKEIAKDIKKIKENSVLLTRVGSEELEELKDISDIMYMTIVQEEIKSLEKTTLTEEQELLFKEIKLLVENESYSEAFEKILTISN